MLTIDPPRSSAQRAIRIHLPWSLTAAAFLLMLSGASADPVPRPLVRLELPNPSANSDRQILLREVIRQAFLVTAREEFHARTRDPLLREPQPKDDHDTYSFQLNIDVPESGAATVSLQGVSRTPDVKPWNDSIPFGDEIPVMTVLNRVAAWTQGPFKTALTEAKLEAGDQEPAEIPEDLETPAPLEFLSQIAALRTFHAALQTHPDSAHLLTAIAREYALLGSVTEVHWGLEHKVFKARSLLYADRAVKAAPEGVEAAWTRALARMLAGLHQPAAEEIARARKLKTEGKTPLWGDSLAAFARWDQEGLDTALQQEQPLAAYLRFLHAELVGSREQRRNAGNQAMQAYPECFRVAAVLADENALGLRRAVGNAQLRQFLLAFPAILQAIPDLPAEAKAALGDRAAGDADAIDTAGHGALLKRLRELDSAADASEPSLGVVTTLAENLGFVHAVQTVTTEYRWLGVDPEDSITRMEEMLGSHPYRQFVEVYQRDTHKGQAALNAIAPALLALPLSEAAFDSILWLEWLKARDHARILTRIRTGRDQTAPEMLAFMSDKLAPGVQRGKIPQLRRLSPDLPPLKAVLISHEWSAAAPLAAEWVESSNNIPVLIALSKRYAQQEAKDETAKTLGERALVRVTELESSFQTSTALADFYWRHKNFDRWKEVTIESLALPTYGLEAASACSKLADWFMDRREWDQAKPYALQAADSYSAFGLLSAGRCLEGLEEWEEAEKYFRAVSQRYDSSWLDWYFWCHRTGRGDVAAAAEFCREQFPKLPEQLAHLQLVAIYQQLEGNLDQALAIHERYRAQPDERDYCLLSAIVILDGLKRNEERDRLANILQSEDDWTANSMLCDLIRRPAAGREAIRDEELELCYIFAGKNGAATNMAYFLGKVLLNRGDQDRAVLWLQRAATSSTINKWNCTLAAAELTKLGVGIESRRSSEMPDPLVAVYAAQRAISEKWDPKTIEAARTLAEKGVADHPDSLALLLMRANLDRDVGRLAQAEEGYATFLARVPNHPAVLSMRGKLREQSGREKEAVEDYEAALKLSPHHLTANTNLAWIRAASRQPEFRDGAAALRLARKVYETAPGRIGIGPVLLAAAHAEAGEFEAAIKLIREAQEKKEYPDPERLKNWIAAYEEKKPYRRAPAPPQTVDAPKK